MSTGLFFIRPVLFFPSILPLAFFCFVKYVLKIIFVLKIYFGFFLIFDPPFLPLADLKKRTYFCFSNWKRCTLSFCFSGAWQQLFFQKAGTENSAANLCRTLIDTDQGVCRLPLLLPNRASVPPASSSLYTQFILGLSNARASSAIPWNLGLMYQVYSGAKNSKAWYYKRNLKQTSWKCWCWKFFLLKHW